jgi:hypothetical protein
LIGIRIVPVLHEFVHGMARPAFFLLLFIQMISLRCDMCSDLDPKKSMVSSCSETEA